MLIRLFFLMIGFGLAVSGGVTIIIFMNMLETGHNIVHYTQYIFTEGSFYLFIIGITSIWLSIYFPTHKRK
ncbi:hypothetical protein [Terrilactibacillus laevilacticus]|uniref:Uncharacterized protein n=2 Tax=Terrilactibacillus laevilacticus TaxID=1380157 RepID=A0ABW5PQL8_9BACI